MDEKFPGVCPNCMGDGCDWCCLGEVNLSFAAGEWWTEQCLNPDCAFANGIRIDCNPAKPRKDWGEPEDCVRCDHKTMWALVAKTDNQAE